ncbi:MAG TPA: hypothetical protein VJL89_04745, partial [Thermodesulfovibrionia bacterium]|nr:hypothetical protein [Thermodesulfovibrionia bacterium]
MIQKPLENFIKVLTSLSPDSPLNPQEIADVLWFAEFLDKSKEIKEEDHSQVHGVSTDSESGKKPATSADKKEEQSDKTSKNRAKVHKTADDAATA